MKKDFFCYGERGAIDWVARDWLGKTENDWEARRPLPRDDGTTGLRDDETTGPRDHGTTGPRDDETTGRRDDGTTGRRDTLKKHSRSQAFSGILRRSQAFSGILRHSQSCEAVRGSLASEWCRCGASQKRAPRDSTKTYSPWRFTFWDVPQMRRYHAKLSRQAIK